MKHEWMDKGALCALLVGVLSIPLGARASPDTIMLGSGRLDAGAMGIFGFSLSGDMQAGDTLAIHTAGSRFDTEIAIYDDNGRLLATNDNVSVRNLTSRVQFGGTARLTAGSYLAILAGFNTLFRDGDLVPGRSPGGEFRLALETTQPSQVVTVPSYRASDGNRLPDSIREFALGQGVLGNGSVARFDFTLGADISDGDWLAIHTTGTDFDTEIGLYDASGRIVASNDNITDRNLLSRLSFGLDGDNGRRLPAGSYTLLLGGFNTLFRDGWGATSSFSQTGNYVVHLQSSSAIESPAALWPVVTRPVPEPSAALMMLLGLVVLLLSRRRLATGASAGRSSSFISANRCVCTETYWRMNAACKAAPNHRNQGLA